MGPDEPQNLGDTVLTLTDAQAYAILCQCANRGRVRHGIPIPSSRLAGAQIPDQGEDGKRHPLARVTHVASVKDVMTRWEDRVDSQEALEECGCAPSPRERRALWPVVSRRGALGLGVLGLASLGTLTGSLVSPAFATDATRAPM